jgi:hypothetical protein
MPVSLLSEKEVEQLLSAIVNLGGANTIESVLGNCHEFKMHSSLAPNELYFNKKLYFDGFDCHFHELAIEGLDVKEAKLQFRRRSKFPAPYLNRNRRLFNKLRGLLNRLYNGVKIESHCDANGRQVYYKAIQDYFTSTLYKEWGGECVLCDEPYSSGQIDKDHTDVRNDFVIIKFKRTQQ